MSLSGVMKMKQECAKFGAFGADILARLHVSDDEEADDREDENGRLRVRGDW